MHIISGIRDLNKILKALRDRHFGTTNWKTLGLSLGLYMTRLDTIERDKHTGDDCLTACLSAWLALQDGVKEKEGAATWLSLVTALHDIGENAVADGIERDILSD